ncbi:MAG: hypothetical protein IT284_01005 [Bacteroidetes bacterium]|nr:hypothetical protein [Bacteroidota bacterium]
MPNIKYKNALERLIKNFKNDFLSFSREQYTSDGKLMHPGEFGASREDISKKFIEGVVPSSKTIKTKGFILNSNNETTSEQDLIIYSTSDTPVLTLENTNFLPVETVVSVGQIKSVIQTKKDLKLILDNLVKVKMVRDNMGHGSVIWRVQNIGGPDNYYSDNAFDQIFTFVICEKINFTITAEEINELYDEDVKDYLKHNLILDISNGLYGYQIKKEDPFIAIPYVKDGKTMPVLVGTKDEWHLKQFLTNIHIHTSANTIFHPEMARYIN